MFSPAALVLIASVDRYLDHSVLMVFFDEALVESGDQHFELRDLLLELLALVDIGDLHLALR